MPTVIVFSEEITIYIKNDNSLGYILSETIPLSEETNNIVFEIPKHTEISKLYNLNGTILLIKLNGYLELLYDRRKKFNMKLPQFDEKLVKDVFFYSGCGNSKTYLCYILFNDNTIKGLSGGMYKTLTSHRDSTDNYDVLAVDIDARSVQILKLNGTKIILTSTGRYVIENCYDHRLESESYI